MKHSFDEILNGVHYASAGYSGDIIVYLDRETGHFYYVSESSDSDEDTPEDVEWSERYLALPHQNDLNSGRRLVDKFICRHAPKLADQVADAFSRKGAWRRYKDLLHAHDLLDDWHRFEEQAVHAELRAWCVRLGVELTDDAPGEQSPPEFHGLVLLVGLHVTDEDRYAAYRTEMTPLLHAVGGDFGHDFVVSKVLKAPTTEPINRVFSIHFPNRGVKDAFFSDPRYLAIKEKHFDASVSHTTILAEFEQTT